MMPEIDENDVQIVEDDTAIQYFVSSCLTVTCGFSDGTRIGAHFSHGNGGTYGDSVTTWGVFQDAVQNKVSSVGGATWVKVRGRTDMWQPAYLTTAPLAADAAIAGDLGHTISYITGREPQIEPKEGGFVVMSDGSVV